MNILTKGIVFIAATTLVSVPAFAGQKRPQPVAVDLVAKTAIGDMITARNSRNRNVYIGCGTRNVEDGSGGLFNWAFCQAEDADTDTVLCTTTNPELVKTIREINDASFITFSWTDDGTGVLTCSSMGFSTQSFYLLKKRRSR